MKCKRCLDIFISLLVILTLFWWLFPMLALMVYLSSKGPVFFKQKRTGLFGEEFNCYKFRTMVVNTEADVKQATITDERITRLGHFLRETNLDELPQFFNVLKGQMSIVGPRPHMVFHTREFSQIVEGYHMRLQVKPGITGLAQIKGYRGATPDYRSIYKRIQWDNFYVENHSVLLDLQIIGMTVLHFVKQLYRTDD
ncbi:MAG: sugar transferase [Bacteroidia bacterium]|jgi:lipopolysaccharide/colanic/teichoic acid biosynthesis glycosyltransferase